MRQFKKNIFRTNTTEIIDSPYTIVTNCTNGSIDSNYTLVGVPAGASVIVKITFSGFLTRASTSSYSANATVSSGALSQTSQCISTSGSVSLSLIKTITTTTNSESFSVSAVATNYITGYMNLQVELISVNGAGVYSKVTGCWGNSSGANGC